MKGSAEPKGSFIVTLTVQLTFIMHIGLSRKRYSKITWQFRVDDEGTNDENEIDIEDQSKFVEDERRERMVETSTSRLQLAYLS